GTASPGRRGARAWSALRTRSGTRQRVLARGSLPETAAVPAHVPGREILPERLHLPGGRGGVVAPERVAAVAHQPRERGEEPAIDERTRRDGYRGRGGVERVEVRVRHEE